MSSNENPDVMNANSLNFSNQQKSRESLLRKRNEVNLNLDLL